MTERKDMDGLDSFFAAAQEDAPMPSGDFMARMEAQALAERPMPASRGTGPGLFGQFLQVLGGWQGMAGLAAACAAGVWIGVSPPEALWSLYGLQEAGLDVLGVDPLSAFDLALMEG